MSALLDTYRHRRDGVTIPTIAIAMVLSLLVHIAAVVWVPRLKKPSTEKPEPPPLTAYLRQAPQVAAPLPPVPPPRITQPPPAPAPPKVAKPPVVTPKPPPRVLALDKKVTPETPAIAPRAEAPVTSAPTFTVPPPAETDLAAYIEARRRARGEPVEGAPSTEVERANRGALASAALKPNAPMTFESKTPTKSGGLFQIRRRGYDYAEFMFYGWNPNFRRDIPQLIEVRKGDNNDIDIAVIRKIIEIIRTHERGDFAWHSKRRGITLTLSARARDNAGLEDFMMQEFQEELHRYR